MVPIPRSSGRRQAYWKTAWLAARMAALRRRSGVARRTGSPAGKALSAGASSARKASAARRLAISPAAAPPMPSQTMKAPPDGLAPQVSSLPFRMRPVWESMAKVKGVAGMTEGRSRKRYTGLRLRPNPAMGPVYR